MGEVIEFERQRPSFNIGIWEDSDGAWRIAVSDFYKPGAERHEILREIADILIGMIGGLVDAAEDVEPTTRGAMIVHGAVYADGTMDFHSVPMDSDAKREWMLLTLEALKERLETDQTTVSGA